MSVDVEVRELGRTDLDVLLQAYRDLLPDDDPPPSRSELERLWAQICADPRLIYIGAFGGLDKHAKQGFIVRK